MEGVGYAPLARAALAAGDVAVATEASEVAQAADELRTPYRPEISIQSLKSPLPAEI